MSADSDAEKADSDARPDEPEPVDERVRQAQQAFERGDFLSVRRTLTPFADPQRRADLGERDRAIVDELARAVGGDRLTMTLGIAAAAVFAAVFAYYVLM